MCLYILGSQSVVYYFGVTVTLILTSGLRSSKFVSAACILIYSVWMHLVPGGVTCCFYHFDLVKIVCVGASRGQERCLLFLGHCDLDI